MNRLLHSGARSAVGATVIAVVVAALAACSSASGDGRPATTRAVSQPKAIADCGESKLVWRPLRGVHVTAVVSGTGPTVVFANDSGNYLCEWLPLATVLAAHHYRLAVFDYSTSALPERRLLAETLGVARAASNGAPFALVGASIGARLVVEAAAAHPAGLAAMVSLSPAGVGLEEPGHPDIASQARKVTVPTLLVTAVDDPELGGANQQRVLRDAIRGSRNEYVQIPGSLHGVDVIDPLSSAQRSARDHVVRFLQGRLPVG